MLVCTMLVLERNQSWGLLLILFLFFWGFCSFPLIYILQATPTIQTKFFFSKTVFLPGKPIMCIIYLVHFLMYYAHLCFRRLCLDIAFYAWSFFWICLFQYQCLQYLIKYCTAKYIITVKISGTLLKNISRQ